MGLDAVVYCDCYENGRLREPPPCPEYVFVSSAGYLDCNHPDLDALMAFDQWLLSRACEHPSGNLLHHYLGNIWTISIIRDELEQNAALFPTILTKVVYSGIHSGDYLSLGDVDRLASELTRLVDFHSDNEQVAEIVRQFHRKMSELVEASRSVGKPIVF
jgi:hypothetical protein